MYYEFPIEVLLQNENLKKVSQTYWLQTNFRRQNFKFYMITNSLVREIKILFFVCIRESTTRPIPTGNGYKYLSRNDRSEEWKNYVQFDNETEMRGCHLYPPPSAAVLRPLPRPDGAETIAPPPPSRPMIDPGRGRGSEQNRKRSRGRRVDRVVPGRVGQRRCPVHHRVLRPGLLAQGHQQARLKHKRVPSVNVNIAQRWRTDGTDSRAPCTGSGMSNFVSRAADVNN